MDASGSGAVPAGTPIVVIDFAEPTTTASNSTAGCEAADFPASLTGKVAVIQRGTCDFGLKAKNAQDRGAKAVIIFNEGTIGDPERQGLIIGTVEGYGVTIPALEATYPAGRFLVDHPSADGGAVGHDEDHACSDPQRGRGDDDGPHGPHDHLRGAPGLRPRGPRHQRRRLGLGDADRGSPCRWPS